MANEYPEFWKPVLVTSTSTPVALYTVPSGKYLRGLQILINNTSASGVAVTLYRVPDPTATIANGTHDGGDNQATLTDSSESWVADDFIGHKVVNNTDGSEATITDNTATTITGTLSGGTDDDWDDGDTFNVYWTYSDRTKIYPTKTVPANDQVLVTIPECDAGTVLYALAATADVINIQAVGGRLYS